MPDDDRAHRHPGPVLERVAGARGAAADRRALGSDGGFATARLTPRTAAGRSALVCLIAGVRRVQNRTTPGPG